MTIVNVDIKSLEIYVAAWLSQDKTLLKELLAGEDPHGNNQRDFNLPDRLIAKVLIFRIIYGGTEFGFVKDSDFTRVSTSKAYWRNAIDNFYTKYSGLAKWHESLLQEVGRTGKIVTPFGRTFIYGRKENGDLPASAIKNYIVQGTGADIVAIARSSMFKRLNKTDIKGVLINTVHDSIVIDCPPKEVDRWVALTNEVFRDLPGNINKLFPEAKFNLPVKVEIAVGNNQKDLEEIA